MMAPGRRRLPGARTLRRGTTAPPYWRARLLQLGVEDRRRPCRAQQREQLFWRRLFPELHEILDDVHAVDRRDRADAPPLRVVLELRLHDQTHAREVSGPKAETRLLAGGRTVVILRMCAAPCALRDALQLFPTHVAEHFIVDAGDERAGARQLPGAAEAALRDTSVELHGRNAEIRVPQHEDHGIEAHRNHERHGKVHRARETDGSGQKYVNGVLAVLERVA